MTMFPKPKREVDEEFKREIRKLPCVVCGRLPPTTVSHIKTRGSGGDDQWFNCTPMCGLCHTNWEASSPMRFFKKHPHVQTYLETMGWFLNHDNKLMHPLYLKGQE